MFTHRRFFVILHRSCKTGFLSRPLQSRGLMAAEQSKSQVFVGILLFKGSKASASSNPRLHGHETMHALQRTKSVFFCECLGPFAVERTWFKNTKKVSISVGFFQQISPQKSVPPMFPWGLVKKTHFNNACSTISSAPKGRTTRSVPGQIIIFKKEKPPRWNRACGASWDAGENKKPRHMTPHGC